MIELAAMLLALTGFAAIAMSMRKHHREVFGSAPTRRRTLGFGSVGWTLLSFSFAVCAFGVGWTVGPVLWLGVLTAAGIIVTFLLTIQRSAKLPKPAKAVLRFAQERPCQ